MSQLGIVDWAPLTRGVPHITWLGGVAYQDGRRVGQVSPFGRKWRAEVDGERRCRVYPTRGQAEAVVTWRVLGRVSA